MLGDPFIAIEIFGKNYLHNTLLRLLSPLWLIAHHRYFLCNRAS